MKHNGYHFATYALPIELDDGRRTERHLIVIKNDRSKVVCFTDFHKYCFNPDRRIRMITETGNKNSTYVCQFLNYIYYDQYQIRKLTDVTIDMFQNFMNDYGLRQLPQDRLNHNAHSLNNHSASGRSKQSVVKCSTAILSFLRNMIHDNPGCKLKSSELYYKKTIRTRRGKVQKIAKPNFTCVYDPETKVTFRDIPEKVFYLLLNEVIEHHTDILMLVANSAFAGLRPSESCNIRRTDSELGPGIYFHKVYTSSPEQDSAYKHIDLPQDTLAIFRRIYTHDDAAAGTITDIKIDLTQEMILRSDLVNVGGIKKARYQHVYPQFIEMYVTCYNIYMNYIEGRLYEGAYGPLTIGRNGKAMTYASYRNKFCKVIESLIPAMQQDEDPEVVEYARMLLNYNIGPHIFRHWFTVQLVLFGEDVASIQHWRGDSNPESALSYINNKSDLLRKYRKVNDGLAEFMTWRAKKLHGRE